MRSPLPFIALAMVLTILGVCATMLASTPTTAAHHDASAPASDPGCLADADGSKTCPTNEERNVDGTALTSCSTAPMTGFYRDGSCRTGPDDRGVHVVCATMTEDFLTYTKARGNDLSTPSPNHSFPGLSPGDRWCLCAARWDEAREAGVAPPVVLDATAAAASRIVPIEHLRAHAAE